MSTAQRALFVLFALAAAGGLGFLLLEIRQDPQAEELDLAAPVRREAPTDVAPRGGEPETGLSTPVVRNAVIRDEEDPDGTSLTVLVVDDRGRPLPEATIVLVGEEGARVEGQGSLAWAEAAPGSWLLTVDAPGLLPYRREVDVEAGSRSRVMAQLRDHLRLEGRVLDLFGHPVKGQSVWLFPEGQAHPLKEENVKDRLFTVSAHTGEFTLRVFEEGAYRVSVGAPGDERARSAPLDLHLGGPDQLEVVLANGGMLSVEMDNLSPGLQEGRVVLRVAVLKLRNNLAQDESAADSEGRRRRDGGRRARRETEDPATTNRTQEEAAPEAGLEEWKEVAILPLDREGRAEFRGLPVGSDLRLAFLRKNDRFESETPFVLLEGQPCVARFPMPAKRTPAEVAAVPVGTVHPAILAEAGADDRREGVRLVD